MLFSSTLWYLRATFSSTEAETNLKNNRSNYQGIATFSNTNMKYHKQKKPEAHLEYWKKPLKKKPKKPNQNKKNPMFSKLKAFHYVLSSFILAF